MRFEVYSDEFECSFCDKNTQSNEKHMKIKLYTAVIPFKMFCTTASIITGVAIRELEMGQWGEFRWVKSRPEQQPCFKGHV